MTYTLLNTGLEHILHPSGWHITLTRWCILLDTVTELSTDHASLGDGLHNSGESYSSVIE